MGELCDISGFGDDKFGVVPIYKPAGRARGRIFAFHGPGGSWRTTWCEDAQSNSDGNGDGALRSCDPDPALATTTTNSNSVFWLRDILPNDFPHCAIYSVGCGREWCEPFASQALSQYVMARTILEHLNSTPLDERAPVVFVAHSFGGVYVKEAIQYLWGSIGRLRSCTPHLDCLIGVVFIATPHHLSQPPNHYTFLFPDQYAWVHGETRTWTFDMHSVTDGFQTLVELNHYEILSITEQSEGLLETHETEIGIPVHETTVAGNAEHFLLPRIRDRRSGIYMDIHDWLKKTFGCFLDQDMDWRSISFSIKPKLPIYSDVWYPGYNDGDPISRIPERPLRYETDVDTWVHLPINHESWMHETMQKMSPGRSQYLCTAFSHALEPILRARDDFAHSRYILPRFEHYPLTYNNELEYDDNYDVRVNHVRIFLPYLHWDTVAGTKAFQRNVLGGSSLEIGNTAATRIPCLAKLLSVLGKKSFPQYHIRRTLDQFHYSRTRDTSKRDEDQVVSRLTRDERLNRDGVPDGSKMIMVDQLWLCFWIVERRPAGDRGANSWKYNSSGVLTAFPYTAYERPDCVASSSYRIADFRQIVLKQLEHSKSEANVLASTLVASILSTVLKGTLSIHDECDDWSLDFRELFREAIGNVSEKQDNFFRSFDESMAPSGERITIARRRQEIQLGLETADIIDELHMLKQLLVIQKEVLERGLNKINAIECLAPLWIEMSNRLDEITADYLPQIERMIQDAERVQRNLLNILDLQQNEESLYEAQSTNQTAFFTAKQALVGQEQADATDAQSQILFVFTVVTIVFLPLSFFTSFFGMNIKDGNDAKTYDQSQVDKVMGWSSAFISAGLIMFAVFWYNLGKTRSARDRRDLLLKLDQQGRLPDGLVEDEELKQPSKRERFSEQTAEAFRKLTGSKALPGEAATGEATKGMTNTREDKQGVESEEKLRQYSKEKTKAEESNEKPRANTGNKPGNNQQGQAQPKSGTKTDQKMEGQTTVKGEGRTTSRAGGQAGTRTDDQGQPRGRNSANKPHSADQMV